jgi:hypothetical protein
LGGYSWPSLATLLGRLLERSFVFLVERLLSKPLIWRRKLEDINTKTLPLELKGLIVWGNEPRSDAAK